MSSDPSTSGPPLAVLDYRPGELAASLEFLKRTRSELRSLQRVRVWTDRVQVFDVNHNYFEIRGLGYHDADVVPVLRMINTSFKPETIHSPIDGPYKELPTGRRYPWAHDRVL